MAKEIEMAKCEQAQKRLRILKEQLRQMNSACDQSIENIQHSGGEVKHAQDATKVGTFTDFQFYLSSDTPAAMTDTSTPHRLHLPASSPALPLLPLP